MLLCVRNPDIDKIESCRIIFEFDKSFALITEKVRMLKELQLPEEWSDVERWAWEEIRANRIADFNVYYKKTLDPKSPDGWDDSVMARSLSGSFLETILTENRLHNITPIKGIRVSGAYFDEGIDLENIRIERPLWLESCRFNSNLRLKYLHVNDGLSFEGSWINGDIDLSGAIIGNYLDISSCTLCGFLSLTGSKIGGQFNIGGSIFEGRLNMNGLNVGQGSFVCNKATFKQAVDLSSAKIDSHLIITDSTFDDQLIMAGVDINGWLQMSRGVFKDKVKLTVAKIGNTLDMSNSSFMKELDLNGGKIGNQLVMVGSTFHGPVNMNGIEAIQSLHMNSEKSNKAPAETTFKQKVDLIGAKIGSIFMYGSTFDGPLIMHGAKINELLHMCKANFKKQVDMKYTNVGGELSVLGSKFDGSLNMEGVRIGESLSAQITIFSKKKSVILAGAKIGGCLDLSGASIGEIDLTAATITHDLRLGSGIGHRSTNWMGVSKMNLRNTTVGAIQDADAETDSWPEQMELDGFSYGRLGGLGAIGVADIAQRKSDWFIDWLGRGIIFSPQPYEYLADLLCKSGYPLKADDVLFAARKRSLSAAWEKREDKPREWSRSIRLTLLQNIIGYGLGFRYFFVLGWFAFFTYIGFLVLLCATEQGQWDIFTMTFASLDQVLPVVTLNNGYEKFIYEDRSNWVVMYFYIHKAVGYVLGGFLAAGLAGLTQKS